MSLLDRLQQLDRELNKRKVSYALAGGLVASLYRRDPRATADIDVVVLTHDEVEATDILEAFGLKAQLFRKANLEGGPLFAIKKKSTPVFLVCGRAEKSDEQIGIDLILSCVPWATRALERAGANLVDFGFGGIPCITLEDFILSKFYSVGNQSTRFMDLDDLRSVFESKSSIDWSYVRDGMKQWKLSIPELLRPFVPKEALKGLRS